MSDIPDPDLPDQVGKATVVWHADFAWLGHVAQDVVIETGDGRIGRVIEGTKPPPGAKRLPGLTIPGLANVHSHAFHRALRARTQRGAGDFWAWRRLMYEEAARLDPDSYFELALGVYREMAQAGITIVGEFHYLHHAPGGEPYDDPNAMGAALIAAAGEAGLRMTLIDACYLWSGIGKGVLEGVQLRFGDGSAERWSARVERLRPGPDVRVGAAVHSVRAVDVAGIVAVAGWAKRSEAPFHVHVSEQPSENEECRAATGVTPTRLLADAGVLASSTTAVHATHVDSSDIVLLGDAGAAVCLCPTTERDLGDGVGPAAALAAAGARLCVGTDSHAMIDVFEEARAVELDQRLVTNRRGHHSPEGLLEAATAAGYAALGWDGGRIAAGCLADFITLDLASPRLAGIPTEDLAAGAVFAATAADVRTVVVGGRTIIGG